MYIKSRRAGRDAAPVPAQRTALAELGLAAGPPMSNGLGWAVVLLVFSFFLERKSRIGPDTAAASPGSCLRVRLRRVSRDSLKLSLAQAGG